ncbi:inositol monophosphatase family protein [Catellatospora sp. NPDC049111]|uniref:inositol monophosphatase family protein n=1 Tax=Catellatospora sp. NPDC049111 TaxID=3155271 RepID=UPI0033F096E0
MGDPDTLTGYKNIPELGRQLAEAVTQAMTDIRPKLMQAALTGDAGESENARHTDNFLSEHDLWMHERYRTLLQQRLRGFVYASEEAEPQIVGADPDPDLCLLVDPLDTSELAVRGLHGYTHVMAYSRSMGRPVAAVVGDIFHHVRLYIAAYDGTEDHAFLITSTGDVHRLGNRRTRALTDSIVTNFLMKPAERLTPLARQHRFLEALSQPNTAGKPKGRIGVDFGSVGLCHVAAGFTDAMIEFAKGFAIWDLAPGHYVLHAAGGVVTDLDGIVLPLDYRLSHLDDIAAAMGIRRTFIAAGTYELAADLAHLLVR